VKEKLQFSVSIKHPGNVVIITSDAVTLVIVQLPDDRWSGTQLQRRVINVGCGNADGFEELDHKIKTVLSGVQELGVL
jgi:hypothetical protein